MGYSMRIAVQADDGDEVAISADFVSAEQALITLEIENAIYEPKAECEAVTLTVDKARELAKFTTIAFTDSSLQWLEINTRLLTSKAQSAPQPC
jgi:hypothetical protein